MASTVARKKPESKVSAVAVAASHSEYRQTASFFGDEDDTSTQELSQPEAAFLPPPSEIIREEEEEEASSEAGRRMESLLVDMMGSVTLVREKGIGLFAMKEEEFFFSPRYFNTVCAVYLQAADVFS